MPPMIPFKSGPINGSAPSVRIKSSDGENLSIAFRAAWKTTGHQTDCVTINKNDAIIPSITVKSVIAKMPHMGCSLPQSPYYAV